MRWIGVVLLLLVTSLLIAQPCCAQLNNSTWPAFRHDSLHTGRSTAIGPSSGALGWRYYIGSSGISSPAVGNDAIYVASGGELHALSESGSLLWSYPCGATGASSPAVAYDGTIYVGSADGNLYAVRSNGTLRWRKQLAESTEASPTIGPDGTVYIGCNSGNMYAFTSSGASKFATFRADGAISSSVALASDGTIYFGCSDGKLYALNSNGTLKWARFTGPSRGITSSPAIGPDGSIYIGGLDGYLYVVSSDGSGRGKSLASGSIHSSPAIAADGSICYGSRAGDFYIRISASSIKKITLGAFVDSSPAIDANGTIYVGCGDGDVYAISPDGKILWSQHVGGAITSSPALGGSGSLYVVTQDGFLCSFSVDTTPPPAPAVEDDGIYSPSPTSLRVAWSCADPESGIRKYEYAVGTSPGAQDVLPFTDAGSATNITVEGLPLINNQVYYFAVRATNGAGLLGPAGISDGIKVDFTPPAAPLVADDGMYTSNQSTLHASWMSLDPESGISHYEYAIGTTKGAADVVSFTDAGRELEVTASGLSLISGRTYYFAVRAINGAGVVSGVGISDGIMCDLTPPLAPVVSDDGEYSTSTTTLSAKWSCSDNESAITQYEYAIGTAPGAQDIVSFTDIGTATQVTRSDLNLANGSTCYFSVRAINGAGLRSNAGTSDGIMVDYTPPAAPLVADDGDYTDQFTLLHFLYSSGDPESGVSYYEYSIGTAPGLADVVGWQNVGLAKEQMIDNLNMSAGSTYYANIRAYNWAGLMSQGHSNGIKVDLTPPVITSIDVRASTAEMRVTVNASDLESGVKDLEYVLLDSPIPPALPSWISALAGQEIIIPGPFLSGQAYYVYARAANPLGNWSEPKLSDKVVLDSTPPTTPLVIDDGEYWGDSATLHASWNAQDPESGIDHYIYCVGLAPGTDDEVKWTDAREMSVSLSGLRLINGGKYYFSVKAVNRAGAGSAVGASDGITIDTTPPSPTAVADDGDYTGVQESLHAVLSSSDPQSGIAEYFYCAGTAPGADNITSWKSNGTSPEVMIPDLLLNLGVKYYISAKARSGAGQWGPVGISDGIEYRAAASPWPRFRGDSNSTGRSSNKACTTGRLQWRVQTEGYIESSAAIAGDGTIFIGSSDGKLYAINAAGIVRWTYQTGECIDCSPAIGKQGEIYVGSYDGGLYCLLPSGALKWKYQAGDMIWSSPAIAADGTIYFGCQDEYLYALTPGGALKWKYKAGGAVWSSPALGADGTVYFACGDGKLYAVSSDGAIRWTYRTSTAADSSPAVAENGVIYFGSGDGYFYAIDSNGTLKWSRFIGNLVDSSAAIGPDGNVYVGSGGAGLSGSLYAFSPAGVKLWSTALPGGLRSSPAMDSDGNIYIGCTDNKIYAIKPGGAVLWSYATGQGILSSPAIGLNGSVVIGSDDGCIYCFKDFPVNDATPPTVPVVRTQRSFIALGTPLACQWSASDPESGIAGYSYAVGSAPDAADVRGWTDVGAVTSLTLSDLRLVQGRAYYVLVKAVNNVGLVSKIGVSVPVLVVPSELPGKIGDAQRSPAGTQVYLATKVVTAVFGDCVFVEEPDRSAGIRCMASASNLTAGSIVDVLATVGTLNDEIVLTNAKLEASGVSDGPPGKLHPLLISAKSLNKQGIDPGGLLVKIAGRVAYTGMDYFILVDGSRISSQRGMKGIEVRINPYSLPSLNAQIAVTGVLCREIVNGKAVTLLRALPDSQVSAFQPKK